MVTFCPNCSHEIEMGGVPVRGPSGGGDNIRNEAYICSLCTDVICVWCYIDHIEKQHPEQYSLDKKKKDKKKKK